MNEKEIKYTSPKENLIDVKFEREEPYGENIEPETSEGIDVVIIDPEDEYKDIEKMMELYKGEVIHLSSNNKNCYFNPFDLIETNIMNEDIVKNMRIIIECKKALNEDIDIKEILNEICIKSNLELLNSEKEEILKVIKEV
jgi:hypothetical protein